MTRERAVGLAVAVVRSLAFRAAMTVALLLIVFLQVDLDLIGEKIRTGDPVYGAAAVLAVAAALVFGALRWGVLLAVADVAVRRRDQARIYAVTAFANAFLPTSVGGDIARPLMVSRRGPMLARTITTVLEERIAALVALLMLAWIGVAVQPETISDGAVGALAVASGALLAGLLVLLVRPSLLTRLGARLLPERLHGHLGEAAGAARGLLRSPRALLGVLVLSLAFQVLVTVELVLLARMIDVELGFGLAAAAQALTQLATLLPISIGGFGVREGSYVAVFAGGSIAATDAVLISLLTVFALFLATLPGALALIRHGFVPAIPEAET